MVCVQVLKGFIRKSVGADLQSQQAVFLGEKNCKMGSLLPEINTQAFYFRVIAICDSHMSKRKFQEVVLPAEVIASKIFLLRKQKVMLDRDLAELYGVKSIGLREQVKRNIERVKQS